MKNIMKKLVLAALAPVMLSGCIEETFPEGGTVTADQVGQSATALQAMVNSIPTAMILYGQKWACEARRYYFNICGKYGAQVQALLKKASTLDIECICPLHGPILKENLGYYIGLYDTWSRYDVETEGIFIAYASIHGGTAAAAHRLADILRAKGAPKVSVADLSRDDMAEAVEDAFRMDRLVVAAASYDGGVFPPMHDFLHHLQIKSYQKRKVGIVENGSWAPCAARVMRSMLETMKDVEIVEPVVTIRSRMKQADIPALEALADELLK